jgi:hypothetical protein
MNPPAYEGGDIDNHSKAVKKDIDPAFINDQYSQRCRRNT